MKQLKCTLWLLLFLSCISGDDYVSIQQIDSHFPVLLKVNNETIQYIEFPLVFQIKKTIDKEVKLSGDGYFTMLSIQSYPRADYSTGTYLLTLKEN